MAATTEDAYNALIDTLEPSAILTPAVLATAFGVAFNEFRDNPAVVEFLARAQEIAEALGEEVDRRLGSE
ncbi:hypothetical protein SEA_LOSER_48 [Mycobacterium phage Loser]|uniref:hypothetical protein n=1 Tax=Mycobacterium phage Loser TaxID=1815969 RepID=UPI00078E8614|nr:hypothetical protein SEA_LOSER_48 [Mycobacterium phage Loser]AMS00944.1 hypothetical protein SEA_LOSER_48 [Mycobacterium phage Loser]